MSNLSRRRVPSRTNKTKYLGAILREFYFIPVYVVLFEITLNYDMNLYGEFHPHSIYSTYSEYDSDYFKTFAL